jgi:hypothetical protein
LVRAAEYSGDLPRCNIGEGEPVAGRVIKKIETGLWQWCCVITCDQSNWTKAHCENLEDRVTACARAARRVYVEMERSPKRRQLSHADEVALDDTLATIRQMLAERGNTLLEHGERDASHRFMDETHSSTPRPAPYVREEVRPNQTEGIASTGYALSYRNLAGAAFEDSRGFHVMSGTEVRDTETGTLPEAAKQYRAKLVEQGVLIRHPFDPAKLVFTTTQTFNNGTSAAKIVTGSKQSGSSVWLERSGPRG